jgi:heparan-alpha-glucosaminide N-acetyltransferase
MNDRPTTEPTVIRIAGIDAYRGFVMFLMMAEVLRLSKMAENFPESPFWKFLSHHQSHVAWVGCSLHDLIQPSFSFLVGVALPFSLARRSSLQQTRFALIGHAVWRAFALVALGVILRSTHSNQTNFTFEDTLSQIGLGYVSLFLFGLMKPRWTLIGIAVLLVGYWGAFALYPLPGAGFDYAAAGVAADWEHHAQGFAAHWNKNTNLAWAFDVWFLNLFPRETPFEFNKGGYATLSFIPTLATMMMGLVAGRLLRDETSKAKKLGVMFLAGVLCIVAGYAADYFGICPNVKRIWTPSWALFSGGWCFLLLAFFYGICDAVGFRIWAYPLQVIGANSIMAYCMAHLIEEFIVRLYKTHLGQNVFESAGVLYEPLVEGIAILLAYYVILQWMYWRKIFLRI